MKRTSMMLGLALALSSPGCGGGDDGSGVGDGGSGDGAGFMTRVSGAKPINRLSSGEFATLCTDVEQARQLSEDERRELAIELLDSAIAPEIQEAWIDEARQRVADVDSGKVATLSNEEALRIIASDD